MNQWFKRIFIGIMRGRITINIGDINARFRVYSVRELQQVQNISREKILLDRIFGELRSGDTIFDIGASIGTHTIPIAINLQNDGSVIAFEPEERAAQRLRRNVALNHLTNVNVIQQLLCSIDGSADLYVDDSRVPSGLHTIIPVDNRRAAPTAASRGDSLISSGACPTPNLVKIDVEGAELEVIEGLSGALKNPACRLVICEVHPALLKLTGKSHTDVESILTSLGFINMQRFDRGSEYHLIASKNRTES